MEHLITFENFRSFAYCNDRICQKPIRGIAISFFGLGGSDMYADEIEPGKRFAKEGILYLVPYTNPWAWMNRQTVDYTDELVDVLMDAYRLPQNIPIVSTGGSMGGLSALVYTAYAKRTPVACVANCPVCDLPFHYTEREDLPRTLYSAFGQYPGRLDEALRSASPLHLIDRLPTSADYFIFHCEEDQAVNKQMHSDRLVEAMRNTHHVKYYTVPERGHCDLTEEMWTVYNGHIMDSIGENAVD